MSRKRKTFTRHLEELYPYLLTTFSALIVWYLIYRGIMPTLEKDLFTASLGLFGVLLGFLSTTKAILIGMKSPVIDKLQNTQNMNSLLLYISEAVWGCFIACIVNIVAFFVKDTSVYTCYSILWAISCVFALSAFFRITNIMLSILKTHYVVTEEENTEGVKKRRGKATPIE